MRRTFSAPTARTTSGARSEAVRCMAAMKASVQSSPRPAISSWVTAVPARTQSVSVDQRCHRCAVCSKAGLALSRDPPVK